MKVDSKKNELNIHVVNKPFFQHTYLKNHQVINKEIMIERLPQ